MFYQTLKPFLPLLTMPKTPRNTYISLQGSSQVSQLCDLVHNQSYHCFTYTLLLSSLYKGQQITPVLVTVKLSWWVCYECSAWYKFKIVLWWDVIPWAAFRLLLFDPEDAGCMILCSADNYLPNCRVPHKIPLLRVIFVAITAGSQNLKSHKGNKVC